MIISQQLIQIIFAKGLMIYFFCQPLFNLASNPLLPKLHQNSDFLLPLKGQETPSEVRTTFSPTILFCSNSQENLTPMEPISKIQNQKFFPTDKKSLKDDDYSPENEGSKRTKKSKQLENRNVVPNIVRLVLSFVQKKGKSEKIVETLLKKMECPEASLKRFFLYHKLVKNSLDNYVNEETLSQLVSLHPDNFSVYSLKEQLCYNEITRKMILHFLRNEATICVITSKRMEQNKKRDHICAIKTMTDKLRLTLKQ